MTISKRPLVDPSVFALAERWMNDYDVIKDGANREDLTWELAGELQEAVEAFFEVSSSHRLVRMKTVAFNERLAKAEAPDAVDPVAAALAVSGATSDA